MFRSLIFCLCMLTLWPLWGCHPHGKAQSPADKLEDIIVDLRNGATWSVEQMRIAVGEPDYIVSLSDVEPLLMEHTKLPAERITELRNELQRQYEAVSKTRLDDAGASSIQVWFYRLISPSQVIVGGIIPTTGPNVTWYFMIRNESVLAGDTFFHPK